MADDSQDQQDDPAPAEERAPRGERRPSTLRGLARRILFDEAPGGPGVDADGEANLDPEDEQRRRLEAKAVLAALLETGDKAKTETIRMVAREVRGYLEALELHKDLNHLLTNYSLEVKASIHLEPLARDSEGKTGHEPKASVGLKKKARDTDED